MKNRETRELLIEKAIDLFYERGFGRSSIRDIVKSAGVTNSAVYNHFRDKDELLYVIIERIGSRILEILHDVEAKHEHPLDRLTEMVFQQTCIVKERRKEVKIYLEEQYQLSPKLKRKALNQHRIVYDFYMKQLCDLEKMGLVENHIEKKNGKSWAIWKIVKL